MCPPVGGCGSVAAGRARAAEPHMSQPRAPEGDGLHPVSETEEFKP
jgi:hypothetical protein